MLDRLVIIVRRIVTNIAKSVINVSKVYSCNVRNHIILLDVDSNIEQYRAITYISKEPETLDWIERYFAHGDVMYDVGANIGLYSLFAAKHLGGNCKIFAFEPEALNYAKLNVNVHLNKLTGNIVPCCLALTDKVHFDNFYLNPNNFEEVNADYNLTAGSALHSFGIAEDYLNEAFHPFHVQGMMGVSLDHLWQEWDLDFPNHIKIDVDGLEEKIISGGSQTLLDRRLKSVLIEVSSEDIARNPIVQKLADEDFVQVNDFELHSSVSLKGTKFENSVNTIFIRGL
ncbi:MAG: FkbM family methyltransferase [Anaerolineales bacterium]|nr:FkbM family methyltransferase [Anaerolineales bacterium]